LSSARQAERLDQDAITSRLAALTGWRVEGTELAKTYKFKNFVEAVDFVNAIAKLAEASNHHPDLLVRWGEVTVRITTHSAGGITEKDFALASTIDGRT
jgi:4a-hydroxytetrahydrobiopterin dehydratase